MPTATLSPTSTEIVHAGQPSAELLSTLKDIGTRISDADIGACYARVEGQRRRFVSDIVRLGVMLLAKKQALSHGSWKAWVIQMTKSADSALLSLPAVVQEKSLRTCQVYMQVGKHFLADQEQGSFQPEAANAAIEPPACSALDVVLLPSLSEDRQLTVDGAVEHFISGRSLDRMLIDFRRAEHAADQEDLAEESRKRKKKKPEADPSQIDFYQDMLRPLGEIDTLIGDKAFVRKTDRAFWVSLADSLEAQAARARKLAKEIAE